MLERILTVDMLVAVVGLISCIVLLNKIYNECGYDDHTQGEK